MRFTKLMKKEYLEFIRDRGFVLMMILEPLFLMLIFGYTFHADIDNLNTIVINENVDNYSIELVDAIDNSNYFKRVEFEGSLDEARDMLRRSKVRAIFYIPDDFGSNLNNASKANLHLYLDSSDYTIYNILKGASGEVIKDSLKDIVTIIVSDLEGEKDYKQGTVDEVQVLVDDINIKSESNLDEIENMTSEFDDIRALIVDTENKISNISRDVKFNKARVENMQYDVLEMEGEVDDVRDDVVSMRSDLSDLGDTLTALVVAQPALAPTVNPIIDDVNSMDSDVSNMISSIDDLNPRSRIDVDSIDMDSINVSSEYLNIDEYKYEIDTNEAEVDRLIEKSNSIESEYTKIQNKIDGINLELRTLKKEFLSEPLSIDRTYEFGEISYFQYLAPAIMSMILFFLGVVITTINIIDERNSKTLFRLATTPLRKIELLGAKFVVFFLIGVVEAAYVLLIAKYVFNVAIAGSVWLVLIVLFLLMACSIGIGLLISTIVRTMRQAIILVPFVVIPSILISQTFSPIEVMPKFMQYVSYISPMLYSNVALREIMIKGSSFAVVSNQILILTVFTIVTLTIGVMLTKKRIE